MRRRPSREDVKAGRLDPSKVNEKTLAKYLYYPDMPDVDLFLRPSGEQRTSNYLLWQSAYAEMVFQDVLWPDFDRRDLWRACVEFASRDRRFGGAVPNEELLAMEEAMKGEPEDSTSDPPRVVVQGISWSSGRCRRRRSWSGGRSPRRR